MTSPLPVLASEPRRSGVERGTLGWTRWCDPLLLGLVAVAISGFRSWSPSFWHDEAATVSVAGRDIPDMVRLLFDVDAVHGAYYLGMHGWLRVVPLTEFWLRLPSVLAVGIGAAGLVVLGKLVSTRRVALVAALVFAILPRVTSAGIEARSYALSAALAVWVTVVFVVAVRRRTGTAWVLYALFVAVSTTVFLYSILIVAAHVVTLAVTKTGRRCVGSFVLAACAGIAIAAPVIVLVQSQADQVSWIAGRNFDLVWIVLVEQYFDNALPVAVVSGLLVVAGVTVGIVRERDRRDGDQAGLLATAVPWLVVPTALVLLYSLTSQNVYLGRYFTFTAPACALLLGQSMVWIAGLAGRRSLPLLAVILALFGAIALPYYLVQRGPYAKPSGMDYSRVADLVESESAPGDCVLYDLKNVWNPGPMRTVETVDPPAFAALRDISRGSTAAELGELWDETLAPDRIADQIRSCPAIWLLTDRSAGVDSHTGAAVDSRDPVALGANFRVVRSYGFDVDERWQLNVSQVVHFVRRGT
ncbi:MULTISPECIES: glycosyltransferase family 39 protein [Rhodococcus]|uniref:glycosyltransferase family 39 protein n=1 Tax=Rhodococcus TaxID=1827 RepID=UPI0010631970|nr:MULTISPECIES: glycosyltransferase family 39 protein [Rhodococcus]MDJ0417227.1 glycosyltransferase family 39 protein [Rhodococcus opacus]NHU48428.1 hypothetical protein [Rhodococcus sp. A14]GLK38725.1 mannosyltransferase [Rhodococcus wratislaviensis]